MQYRVWECSNTFYAGVTQKENGYLSFQQYIVKCSNGRQCVLVGELLTMYNLTNVMGVKIGKETDSLCTVNPLWL